jgi:hypothetical protein
MAVNLTGMLTSLNEQFAPKQEAPQIPLAEQNLMQRSGVTDPMLQRFGQGLAGVFGIEARSPQVASSEIAAEMYDVSTPQYKYELARRIMPFDPQQGRALLALAQQQEEAEKNRALRKTEQEARQKKEEGTLGAADKKAIRSATDEALSAEDQVYQTQDLANRYDELRPTGGVFGSTASAFNTFIGRTTDVETLKTEYKALRNEFIGEALPPGAASDADVLLAKEGFPTEEYSADQIASFLRGMSKMAAIRAEKSRLRADYLSKNKGDDSGFANEWTTLRNSEGFVEGLSKKYNFAWKPIEEPVDFNTAKMPTPTAADVPSGVAQPRRVRGRQPQYRGGY